MVAVGGPVHASNTATTSGVSGAQSNEDPTTGGRTDAASLDGEHRDPKRRQRHEFPRNHHHRPTRRQERVGNIRSGSHRRAIDDRRTELAGFHAVHVLPSTRRGPRDRCLCRWNPDTSRRALRTRRPGSRCCRSDSRIGVRLQPSGVTRHRRGMHPALRVAEPVRQGILLRPSRCRTSTEDRHGGRCSSDQRSGVVGAGRSTDGADGIRHLGSRQRVGRDHLVLRLPPGPLTR